MKDPLDPNALRKLLRQQLEDSHYWQDSKMREFRKQFWEPLDMDLNQMADEILSSTAILSEIDHFLHGIQNF